jgi:UDPglucose 6-dehydrogenase
LPDDLSGILTLAASAETAVTGADAIVISTAWPQFRDLDWERLAKGRLVVDANGFLEREIAGKSVGYLRVGRVE